MCIRDRINSLHNILNVPYQSGNQNAEKEEKVRELVLENVSFRYSEGKAPTIQGINLHIKAGEKVALIGVNGAGKTTPVSYTHLDVYKRQVAQCFRLSRWNFPMFRSIIRTPKRWC